MKLLGFLSSIQRNEKMIYYFFPIHAFTTDAVTVIDCASPTVVDDGALNIRSKYSSCPAVTPDDIVVADVATT